MPTYLHTSYTILGYVVELVQDDVRTEVTRGGNHPMCSESVLLPLEAGEDPTVRPMAIPQIRALALQVHREQLEAHPGAVGSFSHDKDSQDEEMAMLERPDKMRRIPGLLYRLEQLRKYQKEYQQWYESGQYPKDLSEEFKVEEAALLLKLDIARLGANLKKKGKS
jgi:hypothetical protein